MEKRRSFLISVAYFAAIIVIIYLVFKYAATVLLPFLAAVIIVAVLQPVINFLNLRCRFNRPAASVLTVILFFVAAVAVIALCAACFFDKIMGLIMSLPDFYVNSVEPQFEKIADILLKAGDARTAEIMATLFDSLSKSAAGIVSSVSVGVITYITDIATKLPGIAVKVLITIIATFFTAVDYDNIIRFFKRQLSPRATEIVTETKRYFVKILFRYMRSYALIFMLTFSELSAGLVLLNVKEPFLIAFLISLFDILPVFGSGGILVPWAIVSAFNNNYTMTAGLIIIYIVVTIVRNFTEPRIIGKHVGVHPFVTLLSMYVGARLFGFVGLFGIPVAVAVVSNLNDKGVLHLYKTTKNNENNNSNENTEK